MSLWLLVVALWIGDVTGRFEGAWLARLIVALALVLTAVVCGARVGRALVGPTESAVAGRLLLALTVLGIVVHFVGLGHELAEHYYLDEGTYYANAVRINEGKLFQARFVYPHLLYYMDALTLWTAELFEPVVGWTVASFTGFQAWIDVEWYLLRALNALLAALVVVPVFRIAFGVTGLVGGAVSGLLIVFSPLLNGGAHVNISDVPSTFFAAFALMYVARLLQDENRRDYVLAGVFAGLAAGTKYPAGVVAIGIIAAWVRGRLRDRQLSLDLLWAGLSALAVFVLSTPSLLKFPDIALFGKEGIFFGVNQYAGGGWIGVMPASHSAFYGGLLLASFGLPIFLLGLVGVIGLSRRQRLELAWLAVFPVVFLILMIRMNMVVERNLYPVLPAVAACLGIAASGCWISLSPSQSSRRRALATAVILAGIAIPVGRTVFQAIGFARPSTRQATAEWMGKNLPIGARILKESYTPHLPADRFVVRQQRFAARFTMEQVRRKEVDFMLLSGNAYHRFLDPERRAKEHHEEYADFYHRAFADLEEVREFAPGRFRRGPRLRLFVIDPEPVRYLVGREFRPGVAFVGSKQMVSKGPDVLAYSKPDHWAAFKDYFQAGQYRVEVVGEGIGVPGVLRVQERLLPGDWEVEIEDPASTRIELPENGKYFFYLRLPSGGRVSALRLARMTGDEVPPATPGGD